LEKQADGKLRYEERDPDANGGVLAKQIAQDFGFHPMQAGLFDDHRFYFYLTLSDGDQQLQVPLPQQFTKEALKQSLLATLKRFSPGYLKTLGLALPKANPNPYLAQYGMDNTKHFEALRRQLETSHNLSNIDLNQGVVPETVDILIVAAPDTLDDKGLFAIDQFLMKGGTVLLAISPYQVRLSQNALSAQRQPSKLEDWLKHNGLRLDDKLVLDPRNQPFPIPVTRNVGGISLRELRMVPYPYFVEVRDDGLNPQMVVTKSLNRVLINWAAPIEVDQQQNSNRKVDWLLKSSAQAWTSTESNLIPRLNRNGGSGFPPGKERGQQLLGVAVEGRFDSWFKDKPSPLLATDDAQDKPEDAEQKKEQKDQIAAVIDHSPTSARLILFSSADFLSDQTLQLASSTEGQRELGALQLIENSLDWSLEDAGLLSIRSRGHYARTLIPLGREAQAQLEYLAYGLALFGLLLVFLFDRLQRRRTRRHFQLLLEGRN